MKISLLNASLLGCLLIAGCATTPPKLYSVADTSRAASLTLKSDQNYFIGAHTYENADNCVGITTLYELDQQQNSIKTVELEADKEFGLTVLVKPKAKSFYDYSCSFSLFFTPKENIHYEITSTLDEEKRICTSKLISNEIDSEPEFRVIDAILPFSNKEGFSACGVSSKTLVQENGNLITGLYKLSMAQALVYDYHPRRLEPR